VTVPPRTPRERIRAQLPADVAREFDAIMEWEDGMLVLANESAAKADALLAENQQLREAVDDVRETLRLMQSPRLLVSRDQLRERAREALGRLP